MHLHPPHNHLIRLAVALFTIMNPLGKVAIFIDLVQGKSKLEIHQAALITSITVAIMLVIIAWVGLDILHFFGIGLPAFQIAGGFFLFGVGFGMLRGSHIVDNGKIADAARRPVAVVPMAMPILVGPGVMSALVIHERFFPTSMGKLEVSGVCLGITIVTCIILMSAPLIQRVLGKNGIDILTKVMGLILASLSIQMVADAILLLAPTLK